MRAAIVLWVSFCGVVAHAYQPPSTEMIERYRRDGSFEARLARARGAGNHRIDPRLLRKAELRALEALGSMAAPEEGGVAGAFSGPAPWMDGIVTTGTLRALVLLLEFNDYPHTVGAATMGAKIFGAGNTQDYPYESARNFYRRSSYGQLEITGDVLGWYRFSQNRAALPGDTGVMVQEALSHYDAQGYDFSPYDNDGDGQIDLIIVAWTGPDTGWGSFWWAYAASFGDQSFTVDGLRLGRFNWLPETSATNVFIHELGHALGLPDYYDYDDSVGPRGGVGGLDMMHANKYDHNAFSKFLLGWITPTVVTSKATGLTVMAMSDATTRDAARAFLLTNTAQQTTPFGEYFMVERRRPAKNDLEMREDGFLIWHVDARLNAAETGFLFNNSDTSHKLLRLVEADGREDIEAGLLASGNDYYKQGRIFGPYTPQSSTWYSGSPSYLGVSGIAPAGSLLALNLYRDGTEPSGSPLAPSLPAGEVGYLGRLVYGFDATGVLDLESGILDAELEIGTTPGGGDLYSGVVTSSPFVFVAYLLHNQQATARVRFRNGVGIYSSWSTSSTPIVVKRPQITSIEPPSAAVGERIVIGGIGLEEAEQVFFSGLTSAAAFTFESASKISAPVPNNALTGPIKVGFPWGSAASAVSLVVVPQIEIRPAFVTFLAGREVSLTALMAGVASSAITWSTERGQLTTRAEGEVVLMGLGAGESTTIVARSVADPKLVATAEAHALSADLWPDGKVDLLDLAVLYRHFTGALELSTEPPARHKDLDGDGDIDDDDLEILRGAM